MDRPATPPTNLARSAHLDQVVESLVDSYPGDDRTQHIDATFLPSRARAVQCIELVRKIVFPGFFDEERLTSDRVRYHIGALAAEETRQPFADKNGGPSGNTQKENEQNCR